VLLRLMDEGLDRHEAIHAIGSVLAEKLFVVISEQEAGSDRRPALPNCESSAQSEVAPKPGHFRVAVNPTGTCCTVLS